MRSEAYDEALHDRKTTIFNLENGPLEYARWLVASIVNIDGDFLRNPKRLTAEQLTAVKAAIAHLKAIPLNIVTMGSPKAADVARVMMTEIESGSKTLWLDYIQLVKNGITNTNDDIAVSSQTFRAIALNNSIPVIVASQFSRNIETRGENADPVLSDLRGSGTLEQDSTHVISLRAKWANPTQEQLNSFPENVNSPKVNAIPLNAHVLKSRNSGVGVSGAIKWTKSTNRFQGIDV